ncbi:hypothetical protein [Salinisphaera orenii]|uniref:FDXHR family putative zinc-binding protein n=1 Tax=Salinisphaera orenii TaxID=856731 RepID=UPI0011CDE63E|nr:hypothetical protein [Salinisphaera halophila]
MAQPAQPRTAVTRLTGKLSQCTGCGEVFGGLRAFDEHRVWRGDRRVCLDPAELGYAILNSPNGTRWGEPVDPAFTAMLRSKESHQAT